MTDFLRYWEKYIEAVCRRKLNIAGDVYFPFREIMVYVFAFTSKFAGSLEE
jgi:hypothetical protein